MENKLISVKEYDKIVKDLIEELEEKFVNEQNKDNEKDEAIKLHSRMGFTLQNIMAYAELRKKLFME